MPTPQHIKDAAREKRRRQCVICGAEFFVKSAERLGKTCSKLCGSAHQANLRRGSVQSDETKAKRSQSLKAVRADPDKNAAWTAAAAAGVRDWHADPVNEQAFSARMSERMRARHTDPEFQKRRDERSSRTMKATWEAQREHFVAASIERSLRDRESGGGLWSEESQSKRDAASKWIMTKAQEALHAETDFDRAFTEAQARLRRETPFDGPEEGDDYIAYCQKIGRLTALSHECRSIADPFMAEAIPRFAAAYRALRDSS